MSRKIGIFNVQEQAIEAVQALESQGFGPDDLKVIAKDREHAERIESETDVHADELLDLADNGDHEGRGLLRGTRIPLLGLAGLGTLGGSAGFAGAGAGYAGGAGAGAGPALGAGLLAAGAIDGVPDDGDNRGMRSALRSLGMNDEEVDVVGDAIRDGRLVVVAETDEEADGESTASSADGGKLAAAEEAFRRHGAAQVL